MSRLVPLDTLSPGALRALVKLLLARRTLTVHQPEPYLELQRSGYAYRVASVRNSFVFNEDNRDAILEMLHLQERPSRSEEMPHVQIGNGNVQVIVHGKRRR